MPQVLALAGPTACNKSALALALADVINGEIISVDSGAVYRGMDIGTAKPAAAARAAVRHHLIDVCAPDELFSAGVFCRLARAAAADIAGRGKTPILTGGAMMYYRALREGLHDFPPTAAAARAQIRRDLRRYGAAAMHQKLAAIDSQTAARVAPTDSQRIGRALEVTAAAQQPMSDLLAGQKSSPLKFSAIVLMPAERQQLRDSIGGRLRRMFADGLLQETQAIIKQFALTAESPPLRMAGYRQAAAFLRGEYDEAEMKKRAYYATCQLGKRQLTWLRHWPPSLAVIDPFGGKVEAQVLAAGRAFAAE